MRRAGVRPALTNLVGHVLARGLDASRPATKSGVRPPPRPPGIGVFLEKDANVLWRVEQDVANDGERPLLHAVDNRPALALYELVQRVPGEKMQMRAIEDARLSVFEVTAKKKLVADLPGGHVGHRDDRAPARSKPSFEVVE